MYNHLFFNLILQIDEIRFIKPISHNIEPTTVPFDSSNVQYVAPPAFAFDLSTIKQDVDDVKYVTPIPRYVQPTTTAVPVL